MSRLDEKRYSVLDLIGMAIGIAISGAMIAYIIVFGGPGSQHAKERHAWEEMKQIDGTSVCVYYCRGSALVESHREPGDIRIGGGRLVRLTYPDGFYPPPTTTLRDGYLLGTCIPKETVPLTCPPAEAPGQR